MRSNNVKGFGNGVFFLAIFFIFLFYLSMKINSLSNSFPCVNYSCKNDKGKNFYSEKNQKLNLNEIPSSSLKANYLTSFGKYKKVADVILIDKDTEMPVRASLRKEQTGDFISFQIITGRKDEAGFLHMDIDPIPVRGEHIPVNEKGKSIPEVSHLRSIKGDKYKGIGTTLIRAAINESLRAKKNGELFLRAETGYGSFYSDYRKNETPIPFYYKMGFKAENKEIDKFIQDCIKNSDYKSLPPSALLVLSEEAVKSKNIQFSKDYKFD